MTLNKFLKPIVFIPNIPFILIVLIYVIIQLYKHTGVVEMEIIDTEDLMKGDVKEYIDNAYPEHFRYFIAILFYSYVISTL